MASSTSSRTRSSCGKPDGTRRRLLTVRADEWLGGVQVGSGWAVAAQGRRFGRQFGGTEAIVAVRLKDRRTVTVTRVGVRNALDGPWLVDGAVWWGDRIEGGRAAHRFDLATGARTVPSITKHLGQTLTVRPQGVGWRGGELVSRRALPAAVANALPRFWEVSLVTDGTAYAWDDRKGIGWWSPGSRVTVTPYPHDYAWFPTDVGGAFVYVERSSEGSRFGILDVRTGALLEDEDPRGPIGAVFPTQPSGFAAFLSSHLLQQYEVVPADLPELRC